MLLLKNKGGFNYFLMLFGLLLELLQSADMDNSVLWELIKTIVLII